LTTLDPEKTTVQLSPKALWAMVIAVFMLGSAVTAQVLMHDHDERYVPTRVLSEMMKNIEEDLERSNKTGEKVLEYLMERSHDPNP